MGRLQIVRAADASADARGLAFGVRVDYFALNEALARLVERSRSTRDCSPAGSRT